MKHEVISRMPNFHLRTPWDKPTTAPVEDKGITSMPNHSPIRVVEVVMRNEDEHEFRFVFYNLTKAELMTHDENGRTHIHRALQRRGLEGIYYPDQMKEVNLRDQRI